MGGKSVGSTSVLRDTHEVSQEMVLPEIKAEIPKLGEELKTKFNDRLGEELTWYKNQVSRLAAKEREGTDHGELKPNLDFKSLATESSGRLQVLASRTETVWQERLEGLRKEFPTFLLDERRITELVDGARKEGLRDEYLKYAKEKGLSQDEKVRELTKIPEFALREGELRHHLFSDELKETTNRLLEVSYEIGVYTSLSNQGDLDSLAKHRSLQTERATLRETLTRLMSEMPEDYPNRDKIVAGASQINHELGKLELAGMLKFRELSREKQQESLAEYNQKRKEGGALLAVKEIFDKAGDGKEHLMEWCSLVTVGSGHSLVGLVTEGTYDRGASYIQDQRESLNSSSKAGSMWGTDAEFSKVGDISLAVGVTPLGGLRHVSDAVLQPGLELLDVGRIEAQRRAGSLGALAGDAYYGAEDSTKALSYTEYQEAEQSDGMLKTAKKSFEVAEIAASLALGKADTAGKLAGQMVMSGGMGAGSALSSQLMEMDDPNKKFDIARFVDESISNTAGSAVFSSGMRVFRGNNKVLNVVGEGVDKVDGWADFGSSLGNFDNVKGEYSKAGALLGLAVATTDVSDIKIGDKIGEKVDGFIANRTLRQAQGEDPSTSSGHPSTGSGRGGGESEFEFKESGKTVNTLSRVNVATENLIVEGREYEGYRSGNKVFYVANKSEIPELYSSILKSRGEVDPNGSYDVTSFIDKKTGLIFSQMPAPNETEEVTKARSANLAHEDEHREDLEAGREIDEERAYARASKYTDDESLTTYDESRYQDAKNLSLAASRRSEGVEYEAEKGKLCELINQKKGIGFDIYEYVDKLKKELGVAEVDKILSDPRVSEALVNGKITGLKPQPGEVEFLRGKLKYELDDLRAAIQIERQGEKDYSKYSQRADALVGLVAAYLDACGIAYRIYPNNRSMSELYDFPMIIILTVPGVSQMNDQALRNKKKYSRDAIYSPMELLITDASAFDLNYRGFNLLSEEAILKGAFTKHLEGHEAEHAAFSSLEKDGYQSPFLGSLEINSSDSSQEDLYSKFVCYHEIPAFSKTILELAKEGRINEVGSYLNMLSLIIDRLMKGNSAIAVAVYNGTKIKFLDEEVQNWDKKSQSHINTKIVKCLISDQNYNIRLTLGEARDIDKLALQYGYEDREQFISHIAFIRLHEMANFGYPLLEYVNKIRSQLSISKDVKDAMRWLVPELENLRRVILDQASISIEETYVNYFNNSGASGNSTPLSEIKPSSPQDRISGQENRSRDVSSFAAAFSGLNVAPTHLKRKSSIINYLPTREVFEDEFVLQERRSAEARREVFDEAQSRRRARETYAFFSRLNEQVYSLVPETLQEREDGEKGPERRTRIMQAMAVMHELIHKELESVNPVKNSRMAMGQEIQVWKRCALYLKARGYEYQFPKKGGWTIVEVLSESEANRLSAERRKIEKARNLPAGSELRLSKVEKQAISNFVRRAYGEVKPRVGIEGKDVVVRQGAFDLAGMKGPDGSLIGRLSNRRDNPNLARDVLDNPDKYNLDDSLLISMVELGYYKEVIGAFYKGTLDGLKGERRADLLLAILFEMEEDGVLANVQEFLKLILSFQNFKLSSGEEQSRVVFELLRLNGAITTFHLGDLGIDFRIKSESTARILEAAARGNPIELKANFGKLRLDIEKDASLIDRIVGQSIRSNPLCLENLSLYGFRSNRKDHLDRIDNICSGQIKEANSSVLKYFYEASTLSDPSLLSVRDRVISQVLDDNPFLIFASKRLFGKFDVAKSLMFLNTILLPIHNIGSKEKVNDEDYGKLLGSFFLNKILSTDVSSQERINMLNQTILSNPIEILELSRLLSKEQLQSLKAFAKSNKLWSIQLVLDIEGIRAPSNHPENDFWRNSLGPLMQQAIDIGHIKLDDPKFEGYLRRYLNDFDLAYSPELLRVYLRICSCQQQDILDTVVNEIPGAKEFILENSLTLNKKSLISYLKFLKRKMLSEAIKSKHQNFDAPLYSSIWDNIVGRLYTHLESENPKARLIKDTPSEISQLVKANLERRDAPKMLSRERSITVSLKGNRELAKLSNGMFENRKDVKAGLKALAAIVLDSQVNTLNAFTREGVFTYLNNIDLKRKKRILESVEEFSGRSEHQVYRTVPLLYILAELFENATNHAVENKNTVELRAMESAINVLRRLKTEYEALFDEADRTKASTLAMVPDIGMLRAYSPDISRTCAYNKHKELANAKNITAFMLVEERNAQFEDVVGSVWAVDTQTDPNGPDAGKRVLLIRANNPRMELFGRYDAESLVEAIIDEMIEVAKEENFDYVVLPRDYTWLYSTTNSDKVRNYCLKKYGHCPFLALDPNDPSVKFNGVDNADVNGPNPVVVIWSRSQEVEKIKNTFTAVQTDLVFDNEMNADSEVRDLVQRAAQAIKDYDGIFREWNRAKVDSDYRNGSPQMLERAYRDVSRDLLGLLTPIENLQKELSLRKGSKKILDRPVLETTNIKVRKGKSIEKNDNDARDVELNQISEFSSFGISRGSADEVVATLAHANHNLIPHQQLLIDQFKLLNSKGQAVKLFASSGYQKEVRDECVLVTTNKAPSAADMILYFEKIFSDGILIPCSPDIKIIQINFLGARGEIVEGATNLTRSMDGSYLLRGLPDGFDKLAVSYVKVEKPSFKEVYRELERMPVHDAVINASILDVIERLPSSDTEYERAQKIAKLFCNQGLVYSLDSKLADILDIIPESNKISFLNGLNCGSCDTFSMQLQNLFSQAGIRSVVESGPICKVGSGKFTYPGHARVRVFLEDGRSFVIDPTIHATRNQKLDLNELNVSALIGNVDSLDEVAAFEMGVKIRNKYVVARSTGIGGSGHSQFSDGSEYSGGHSLKDDMDEKVIASLKTYSVFEVQEIGENITRLVEDSAINQKSFRENTDYKSIIQEFGQLIHNCTGEVNSEIRAYIDKTLIYLLELLDRKLNVEDREFIKIRCDLELFLDQLGMISNADGITKLNNCLSPLSLNRVVSGRYEKGYMLRDQSVERDEKLNPLAVDYAKRIIATCSMDDMCTSAEELVPYLLNLADAVTDKEIASEVRRLTREFVRSNNLQIGDLLFEKNDKMEHFFVNDRGATGEESLYSEAIAYGATDLEYVGPVYAERMLETVFGLVPNSEHSKAGEEVILKLGQETLVRCKSMTFSALLMQTRCIKHLAQKYAPDSALAKNVATEVYAKILKDRFPNGDFPYDLSDPVEYLEAFLIPEKDSCSVVQAIDEGILDINKNDISSIWARKVNVTAQTEQDKKLRAERVFTALEERISVADYKAGNREWKLSYLDADHQILLAVLSRADKGAFVGGILEDYVRLVGRSKSKLNIKYVSAVNEIVNLVSEEKRIAFGDNLKATIKYLSVRSVADRIIKNYRLEGTTESIEALGLSLVAKISSLGIGSQSSVLVVNEIDGLCSDQSVGTIFGKEFDFKAWLQVEYPFYEKLNLGKQAEFRYALYRAVFDFLSSTEGQEYLKNEKFNLTPSTVVGPTTWNSSSDFTRAFSYNQYMAEVNRSARAGYISDADIQKEFSDSKFAHLSKFRSLKGKGAKASPFIVEGRTSSKVSLSRSDDYGLLADYQKGDPIKSVDWRASAGKQNLKVRTFHQPNQNQESNHYEILVDGRVLSNQDESVNFANIRNLHSNILALRANNKDVSVTIFLGEGVLLEIGNEEIEKSYIQRQASVDGVQGADILKNLVAYSRMLKNVNTNSNAIKGTKQILFNEPGNFIKANPQLNSNYSKGKKRRSDDSRAFIVFADEFSSQLTVDWLVTNPNIRPNDKVYFSVLFPEYKYEEASRFNLNP